MEENENQRLYREMFLENEFRFLMDVFLVSMSDEKPREYTISGSDELFKATDVYGGYSLEEFLNERYKNSYFYRDIEWDSESGCFFCYTKNPKTVIEIIDDLRENFHAAFNEKEVERFKNHPENRIRIIV